MNTMLPTQRQTTASTPWSESSHRVTLDDDTNDLVYSSVRDTTQTHAPRGKRRESIVNTGLHAGDTTVRDTTQTHTPRGKRRGT